MPHKTSLLAGKFNYVTSNGLYGAFTTDVSQATQSSLIDLPRNLNRRQTTKEFWANDKTSRNYGNFYNSQGTDRFNGSAYREADDFWARKYREYFEPPRRSEPVPTQFPNQPGLRSDNSAQDARLPPLRAHQQQYVDSTISPTARQPLMTTNNENQDLGGENSQSPGYLQTRRRIQTPEVSKQTPDHKNVHTPNDFPALDMRRSLGEHVESRGIQLPDIRQININFRMKDNQEHNIRGYPYF